MKTINIIIFFLLSAMLWSYGPTAEELAKKVRKHGNNN